jgi:hypothetical protein
MASFFGLGMENFTTKGNAISQEHGMLLHIPATEFDQLA